MDALMQVVLLCIAACARGEPLADAMRRHSSFRAYASDFSGDYEPYMFAAIPLHAPVPVLRVLSPAPLAARDRKRAPSVQHPVYARAPYTDIEYVSSAHSEYAADSYEPQQYSSTRYGAVPYAKQYQSSQLYAAASSTPEEPTILYARASPHGGYTYHNAPSKHAGERAPAAAVPVAAAAATAADAPYIIRVHKYRIVKER